MKIHRSSWFTKLNYEIQIKNHTAVQIPCYRYEIFWFCSTCYIFHKTYPGDIKAARLPKEFPPQQVFRGHLDTVHTHSNVWSQSQTEHIAQIPLAILSMLSYFQSLESMMLWGSAQGMNAGSVFWEEILLKKDLLYPDLSLFSWKKR